MPDSTTAIPLPTPGAAPTTAPNAIPVAASPPIAGPTPSPAPLPPAEASMERMRDGVTENILPPANTHGAAEFPNGSVYYVNGIATTFSQEKDDARTYAALIHQPVQMIHAATNGMASDLLTTVGEKLGIADNPPERAVASAVLNNLVGDKLEHPVHFMAHSRGALIVERGLERVVDELKDRHFSAGQIEGVLSGISVETAGGASLGMPAGVRCVNYVDSRDSVANVFGQGRPTAKDIAVLDAAVGVTSAVPVVGSVSAFEEHAYLANKASITHANGPVVDVPPVNLPRGSNAVADLLQNHSISNYLSHRQPFEQTYASWSKRVAIEPRGNGDESRVVVARAAEKGYATNFMITERAASLSDDVQRAVGSLSSEQGVRLPPVREIVPRGNSATVGTFVAVDDRTVAQHVGRGVYQIADVDRDLGGSMPVIGPIVSIEANGLTKPHEIIRDARSLV